MENKELLNNEKGKINSCKEMIIIENEIVTDKIIECELSDDKKFYLVKYKNQKKVEPYKYNKKNVKFIGNPTIIDPSDYNIYLNAKKIEQIKKVYEFNKDSESFYHIIFNNGTYKDCDSKKIVIESKDPKNIIKYLQEVSKITSLSSEDGKKILYDQMSKIKENDQNSALSKYIKLSTDLAIEDIKEPLIFPFGCNSSQYKAVQNAIYNKISIIEGPPGTGKTQTILNIIANIIIHDMNCQVVSNNNSAIENIEEKLTRYNLDFFEALLGRGKNKEIFFDNDGKSIPSFDEYKDIDLDEISNKIAASGNTIKNFYKVKKETAIIIEKKKELNLEIEYFRRLVKSQNIKLIDLKSYNKDKIRTLSNEIVSLEKISFLNKLKFIFFYKIGNFKFYKNDMEIIIKSVQNTVYLQELEKLDIKIDNNNEFIDLNKDIESEFIDLSMAYFKKYLSVKYHAGRKKYTAKEAWKNPKEFLKDYPVVLSTTYSSRNSFNEQLKFDYIIMDESSQIDLVTGALALSSAKYAVIIGDEKQLPNVVPDTIKVLANNIFKRFDLEKCYSYSLNSFLKSVKNAISEAPCEMLVEHYRCHPQIINFCNKKFYDNRLVIMSEDNGEKNVVQVIKTAKGNHARGKTSQRQVDIIKEIVKDLNGEIGIIAPFNDQVDLIKDTINDLEVNTVHKFQGREKDTIIISTVEDDVSDFVGDPKILNVAISRAKKKLYFIVTGNEIKNHIITDFIDYVEYNNMEIINSKIYSCFDMLYKPNELERLKFFKKHNRVSKFDSENVVYYLIDEVTKEYNNISFHFGQRLKDLLADQSLLDEREKKYVNNSKTHLDFYIFKTIGEKPVLAIEVDGYNYHKRGTKQYERDLLKDKILKKYGIPVIRLKTNGSQEKKIIKDKLNEILK